MTRHDVCSSDEVAIGTVKSIALGRTTVLLVRLPSGDVKAINARCPHQGAPLKYGCITGETSAADSEGMSFDRPGEILRCPWHGFEYDLVTGEALVRPGTAALRTYPVEYDGDRIIVLT